MFQRLGWHWRLGVSLAAMGVGCAAQAADLAVPKEMPPAAVPATSTPIDLAFGVRLQSDYNFRGISQSNHEPSIQTYLETQLFDNLLYFGVATERVDLPTKPPTEYDFTAGIRPKFGDLGFDLGIIYYAYPGERAIQDLQGTFYSLPNTDFLEAAGKVSYTIGDSLTLGANVFYTGDFLGTHSPGTYASGTAKYTLPENLFGFLPAGFAISGEFGHYSLGKTGQRLGFVRLPDYFYGNVGISYTYDFATLDVRFHDTDLSKKECFAIDGDPRGIFRGSGMSNWCGAAVVATLSFDITASKPPGVFAPAQTAPSQALPPVQRSASPAQQ